MLHAADVETLSRVKQEVSAFLSYDVGAFLSYEVGTFLSYEVALSYHMR